MKLKLLAQWAQWHKSSLNINQVLHASAAVLIDYTSFIIRGQIPLIFTLDRNNFAGVEAHEVITTENFLV